MMNNGNFKHKKKEEKRGNTDSKQHPLMESESKSASLDLELRRKR